MSDSEEELINAKASEAVRKLRDPSWKESDLSLRNNKIGVEGAKAVAVALKTNTSLTTLDLSGNDIGAEGAKAVVEALKVNKSLTVLKLNSTSPSRRAGNDIGLNSERLRV
mmetsp:Transcript_57571/g.182347  ORF Transcript_57571/g.182347 Transcript_57571/m.182347 type:complete len:111 (+) Transcript_57571:2334-2666(+)